MVIIGCYAKLNELTLVSSIALAIRAKWGLVVRLVLVKLLCRIMNDRILVSSRVVAIFVIRMARCGRAVSLTSRTITYIVSIVIVYNLVVIGMIACRRMLNGS